MTKEDLKKTICDLIDTSYQVSEFRIYQDVDEKNMEVSPIMMVELQLYRTKPEMKISINKRELSEEELEEFKNKAISKSREAGI
jgi:predicted nucleotidyltransferase component of viral defense system